MHYEIWVDDGENVWNTVIGETNDVEEARRLYYNACDDYGSEKVDCFQVAPDRTVYAVSWI